MATPNEVRRALRTLAAGERRDDGRLPRAGEAVAEARETIREAVEASDDVESAATFFADGGVERLRDAVDVSSRAGDLAVRREGERVLALVERYRRAAGVDSNSGTASQFGQDGELCAERSGDVETSRVGTHLGGDSQRADR
ncbi:hypothetical protein [Haloprofundus halophilus]|uniref:hypothetical protein n=1 Tax=Haloprofundus halophilus TaxID=2283527 RepID=UPI000E4365A6|nr:hypothetical protein [Haloprofundus halophilus]